MVSKKNNTKKSSCVYDSNDFNDKNGMLTAIWGPGMWHFLHTMSFNYPNQPSKMQKKQYKDFRERYEHFRARCVFPNKNKTKKKSDKGCVVPLYGEKAKCVLHIVPQDKKCKTLQIDEKCIKKKIDI